ncbi:MAG TPA: helix-turn-helix transcriptional regulator [Thermoanaerobaculia bacterium]|nr:helix-turn-helix transcriptional regulator [Thermoanaerobaculia bacterium]
METRSHTGELRLVVVFLRFTARMTQTGFGRASGVDQGDLSRYETGKEEVSEEVLRRMAAATGVPWHMVAHLRRLFAAVLAAMDGRAPAASRDDSVLESAALEAALLSVSSYLVEEAVEPEGQASEEALGQEEIGPEGQSPGFPLAGGEGAQTAATASRGSRERMRGRS